MLEARGAFAEAEPLLRRGLEGYERQLGPEHRETLIAVNNLASVLEELGKFSEAPLLQGTFCVGCILCWENGAAGKQQPHFQIISTFCMNMSILRKSSQIISNHIMYGRAKTWTC